MGRARSQSATSSTARAICPASDQPGSKATDTLGMRMKSHSVGTMSVVQTSATCFRAAGAAIGLMAAIVALGGSTWLPGARTRRQYLAPRSQNYDRGMTDHDDAHRIATEAGALLLEIRAEAAAGRLDPSQLKDEGDRRSNEIILELLRQTHPDDAVLSEEKADDPSRVNAERTWIVDPLDGTREFREDPRTD